MNTMSIEIKLDKNINHLQFEILSDDIDSINFSDQYSQKDDFLTKKTLFLYNSKLCFVK